ncbi:MAG: hypothetical protein KGJ80_00910 [Chloroflexota bacterium]|nr:hypothetical protein [Chloroflexota bacterium]
MNNKRFSIFRGLVVALAILLFTSGQPRSVLSAPPGQSGVSYFSVSVDPQKPCPEEQARIHVSVQQILYDSAGRPAYVRGGNSVQAAVDLGTLYGGDVIWTDYNGNGTFLYRAPKGQQGATVSFWANVVVLDPKTGGRTMTLDTHRSAFSLGQCSYELWIVDRKALFPFGKPWTGVSIGLGHGDVDNAGNVTGRATDTLDTWGNVQGGPVSEEIHMKNNIVVTGEVSGGTAKFDLKFPKVSLELGATFPGGGGKGPVASTNQPPDGSCSVDAFQGGTTQCSWFNTIVNVNRQ